MPEFNVNGKIFNIPNDDAAINAFLKKFPNAVKVKPSSGGKSTDRKYYDVYNPETMEAAKKAGYDLKFIDPSVRYEAQKEGYGIGHQSEFDPESGFYYDAARSKAPGKKGLEKYMELHADVIKDYVSDEDGATGADAWKRDHIKQANTQNSKGEFARDDKAVKHVVKNVNERYKKATGKDLIDFTKKNAYVPGVQLFNLPTLSKLEEQKKEDEKDKIPEPTPTKIPDGKTPITGPGPQPGPGSVVTTTVDKTKVKDKVPEIERQKIGFKTVEQKAPWWLQDIVGVAGAFGDLNRIKRYPPWQATPNVHLPGATFYDPTRELAANAEQANIQTQGLAAFTGPQALSARSAQIQGQALKNAADVMGRYNNLNVGLANQLEQSRANILNTASQNQANLDTQLWDKYTIMNQQFDNSKAQARQELRKHYINAITNRAKTQALNTLYPNFQVLPETGGYVLPTDLSYTPTNTGQSDGSVEKQLWKQASEIDPANTLEIWKELMRTKYKNKSSQYPYQGYEGES